MNRELIFALTQSVLAVLVVVGAALLVYVGKLSAEAATGIIGLVLGYYFGSNLPGGNILSGLFGRGGRR